MSDKGEEDIKYQSDNEDNDQEEEQEQEQNIANASSFKDFMLKEELLRAIDEAGFERPSPVQNACINLAVNGRDILCQAQAGTGKTAVFVLSILNQLNKDKTKEGEVLIISPTRELATQIKLEFKKFSKHLAGFSTEAYFGGATKTQDDIKSIKEDGAPHIIIGCPGRLYDLVQRRALDLSNVKYFVVDECDRVFSEMKFRDQVQSLFLKCKKEKQVMMFSGTLPEDMKNTCQKFLQNPEIVIVEDTSKLVLNGLDQFKRNIPENQKIKEIKNLLLNLEYNQAMVFVNEVKRAEMLQKLLKEGGIGCNFIHGRLEQQKRNKSYENFKDYTNRVIVCTDLFGRGMDFPRVNLVINFDMPKKDKENSKNDNEQYMHRVGRAGRHYTKGVAISFISNESDQAQIKEISDKFECKIPELPDTTEATD